jgi:hypothetical protein
MQSESVIAAPRALAAATAETLIRLQEQEWDRIYRINKIKKPEKIL